VIRIYDDCPEEKRGKVEASEILAKILRGEPVMHDCVVITGDLEPVPTHKITVKIKDRGDLKLYKISYPITITNSIIQGKVNFEDVLFDNAVECFRQLNFDPSI
jgi:hypothetical protein